jgi:hypothetical protein
VAEFPSEYIIRLNLDGTVDKAYGNQFDSIGTTQGVNSIAIEYSGDTHYCYLVGQFTKYSGINSKNIVKIDEDGNIVTTFNVGGGLMGTNAKANVVKIHADGNIWVGGYFTSYHEATTYRNMIVKIKPNGDVYPSS